jgi:hypothetical protein
MRACLPPAALLAVLASVAACGSGAKTAATTTGSAGGGATTSASSTAASSGSGGATSSSGTTDSSGATGTGGATSSGGTGGAGGHASTAAGTIVPLYSDPTDPSWQAIAMAAAMHPTVTVRAIINPDSGPGTAKDPDYVSGIPPLAAAGIVVLGYVATTNGTKPTASVHGEIDKYQSWYTGIRGIFFDEMSNVAGHEAYYAELTQYAKGLGYQVTVGNPGTDTLPSYVGTVDTILIYESAGVPTLASLGGWYAQHDKSNFGVIPYGVATLDTAFVAGARADVGFIYLTSDTLPNPWDTLSPYFSGLLGALE